jgi:hypothetical protein
VSAWLAPLALGEIGSAQHGTDIAGLVLPSMNRTSTGGLSSSPRCQSAATADRTLVVASCERRPIMVPLILWFLGVPLGVIILLLLLGVF